MNLENMKVISIDDNKNNLFLIETICNNMGLNVTSFSDPLEALLYSLQNTIDLILIDYMMPNLNGLEFIKEFRKQKSNVPIIMITASGDDEEVHKKAFDLGTNDFLSKPVNSIILKARILNLLSSYHNRILIEDKTKLLESEIEKATIKLREREKETLNILGKTAEYKDPETASHVSRVSYYSKLLARELGLSNEEQNIIFYSAPFHDLGKVGIEDNILLKAGKLSLDEFNTMKKHSLIGYEILKDSKSKFLKAGSIIALTHHEKFDGSGYPNNLKEEEIHVYGRIVAIADVFDALTSSRSYKKAWSFDEAIKYLQSQSNKHFDSNILKHFIKNIDEVKNIYNSFLENK